MTRPAAPAPPQTPSARFRSRPSAKVVLMSASVLGKTSAPPRPCTARAASCSSGRRRQAAGERGDGVQRQAGHEHAPPPEQVGGATAEQQEAGRRDRVGADHRLQRLRRVAEVAADLRQRDDDDVLVERDDQHRERQQRQRGGLAGGSRSLRTDCADPLGVTRCGACATRLPSAHVPFSVQLGLLLALLCAVVAALGFLFKQRAPRARRPCEWRHPSARRSALFANKWWTLGILVAMGAWGFHVAALALAPIALVQRVIAGGLALLTVDRRPAVRLRRHPARVDRRRR